MMRLLAVALGTALFCAVACGSDDSAAPGGLSGASGSGGSGATSCTSEDDCTGAKSHCDTARGTCTGCTNDDDCRGPLKCDTATGICKDCVGAADCRPSAPVCDSVSGQCTANCSADADCAATGGPSKCDRARGVCVDCIGPNQPCRFCELETFSCVGCLTDADCPASAPFCGPALECSPNCTSDDDCPGDLHCDPKTSRCLECATNAHCPGEVCQPNFTCG